MKYGADRVGAAALLVTALLALQAFAGVAEARHINLISINGSINPASADYIIHGVSQSETDGAAALLIEMDTPGGLVSATKDIIGAILNSEVPVIVYVAPRGAWAASAGTYITVSAHVAAMAPSTTIGAAHPVSATGGGSGPPGEGKKEGGSESDSGTGDGESGAARDFAAEKAENMLAAYAESIAKERDRNVEWVVKAVRESVAVDQTRALELGVIDLVAEDRDDLLTQIEGREVDVAGKQVRLELAGLRVVPLQMTLLQRIFNFLADPNVAVVLVLVGMIGIYIEVNNPGLIVPGTIGALAMLLAGIAFQILPFSWVGLLIMLIGIGLLVAEIFVTSFGLLFAAGIMCFLLGGTMIFDTPAVSDLTVSFWSVLLPAVLAVSIFGAVVVFAVGKSLFAPRITGVDGLIGLVGRAAGDLTPTGKVFVRGEFWDVVSDERVEEGAAVEVTSVEGMKLRVRRSNTEV